jgi:bifunctional enzyme CysN/CysC
LNQAVAVSPDLLRFLVAGSVDDGKSTLIGRLLYDLNAIHEDHLVSIAKASHGRESGLDLSLVTDGLRAEREQGITIDVAYRYFSTPKRKFIIADCPGHEQYTRNMATGASTAELMVLLVDVTKGVLSQTRRHAHIASLLQIPHVIAVINKMDRADFDQAIYDKTRNELHAMMASLGFESVQYVPVSALQGDNVVAASARMNWYHGMSLLHALEESPVLRRVEKRPFRLPIQLVVRSQNSRHYAGQIASGKVRTGQELVVMSSGSRVHVDSIHIGEQSVSEAFTPSSVSVSLAEEVEVARGDMLADKTEPATSARRVSATLVWLSSCPLLVNGRYLIKHTSRTVGGFITAINGRVDIDTFQKLPASELQLNDIGDVEIELRQPIFCDAYSANRNTGSFILIEPTDNSTAAAGMISHIHPESSWDKQPDSGEGAVVWFTGLSGAGKSTIAREVYNELWARGIKVELIDGDDIRKDLNKDLGFSHEDRAENIRRIGSIAALLARNGVVVLVSAISPYRTGREEARRRFPNFLEVFVNAPLAVCEERDTKGLYRKARAGLIPSFTGLDHPYERPISPEIECRTDVETLTECTHKVLSALLPLRSPMKSSGTQA